MRQKSNMRHLPLKDHAVEEATRRYMDAEGNGSAFGNPYSGAASHVVPRKLARGGHLPHIPHETAALPEQAFMVERANRFGTGGAAYGTQSQMGTHDEPLTDQETRKEDEPWTKFDVNANRISQKMLGQMDQIQQEREKEPEEPYESPLGYAAPPTRGGGMSRDTFESRHGTRGSVTLTKQEVEIAKLANISPEQYARNKLELIKKKRMNPGDYPEG